jgi:hypothetical protein
MSSLFCMRAELMYYVRDVCVKMDLGCQERSAQHKNKRSIVDKKYIRAAAVYLLYYYVSSLPE